jgi:hypothetical protein
MADQSKGNGADEKIIQLAERLGPLADAAGVPRPDLTALQGPQLNVAAPIRTMTLQLAEQLRGRHLLFVRSGVPGTITPEGQWKAMTPDRMTTWLGRIGITTVKGKREPMPEDLEIGKARQLLAADDLLGDLPPLNAVNLVRQPVVRKRLDERGLRVVELLPAGYDEESGVYTIDSVPIDEEMYPEDGESHLRRLLRFFPWSEPARMSAQLAGMLTCFCREMFPGRAPMFVLNSNLPESGKSTLARMMVEPVFGAIGTQSLNTKDEYGTEQKLHTVARNFRPVLWMDDLKGKLFSTQLNEWLTQPSRSGRILGGQEEFSVPVRTVTVITGAQLDLDDHLNRRSIWVDLFPRVPGSERVLPEEAIVIDEDWFRDPVQRGLLLSALWAVVRNWDGRNRPGATRRIGSFEGWSDWVPGMVGALGWDDPLKRFEAPDAGDSEGREMRELVVSVIRKYKVREGAQGFCTPEDIIGEARIMGLFLDTLGTIEDVIEALNAKKGHVWKAASETEGPTDGERRRQAARWRDKALDRAWGARWKRRAMEGQEFVVDGKRYAFGDRRSSKARKYVITEIEEKCP